MSARAIYQTRPQCHCGRPATHVVYSGADGSPRERCESHAIEDQYCPGKHLLPEPLDEMVRRILQETLVTTIKTITEVYQEAYRSTPRE